jgi:DnaK suppressor protein
MCAEDLNSYRDALEEKRDELLCAARDRDEILIEQAADEFDRLQQQLNREVAIRNLDRISHLLKDVQSALTRIEDEIYGICLHCEGRISEKRLNAVPWTAYCITCQEELDRYVTGGAPANTDPVEEAA